MAALHGGDGAIPDPLPVFGDGVKLVEVVWVDSFHHNPGGGPWVDRETVEADAQAPECRSAGYLVFENDQHVTLALGHDSDRLLLPLSIPRCAVVSISGLLSAKTLEAVEAA